jgi:Xaa-Pro aminopeptidase
VQNSDLFYLSGVDQEETILILFPDAADPKQREMLFVRETNEHIAVWEGEKLTKEQATAAQRHPARALAHGIRDTLPLRHVPGRSCFPQLKRAHPRHHPD